MRGRVALRVLSLGRLPKLHQRSLATRVPKLTLFSGPQCSLCEVSHVIHHPKSVVFSDTLSGCQTSSLNSQERRALCCVPALGIFSDASYLQHPFNFEVVNIRDPGQESWMRKYVYWIPVLHIDGQEVARGRWGEAEARGALQKWKDEQDSNNCNQ
jgi:hypothetical protein